jgi:hypothetical protein
MRSGCHRRPLLSAWPVSNSMGDPMITVMVFHEVDDVDHWLRSPKRDEFFGPLGMTVRTFVDPVHTNRVGRVARARRLQDCSADGRSDP